MCSCYDNGRCNGTKEREACECGGNEAKCDFYLEKRKAAKTDMKKQLSEFINAVGAITEIWGISYKSFIGQGLTEEQAIANTQAFVQTLMMTMLENKGE